MQHHFQKILKKIHLVISLQSQRFCKSGMVGGQLIPYFCLKFWILCIPRPNECYCTITVFQGHLDLHEIVQLDNYRHGHCHKKHNTQVIEFSQDNHFKDNNQALTLMRADHFCQHIWTGCMRWWSLVPRHVTFKQVAMKCRKCKYNAFVFPPHDIQIAELNERRFPFPVSSGVFGLQLIWHAFVFLSHWSTTESVLIIQMILHFFAVFGT